MAAIEMLARLKADTSGFTTAIKRAEDSLAQFGNSAQSFGSTVSDKMSRAGSSLNSFGDSAAKTGAIASLSLTTPLMLAGGTALRTASDFESSMSQVAQAVGLLRVAARRLVGLPLLAALPLDQVLPQEVVRRRLEV